MEAGDEQEGFFIGPVEDRETFEDSCSIQASEFVGFLSA